MNDEISFSIDADEIENFLKNASANLQRISTDIIDDLAEITLDEIQRNYSSAEYQPGETMDFSKTGSDVDKTVSMSGPQAWYSEFGTGTRGGLSPHPLKNNFGLNPYNSGRTIRAASSNVTQKTGIPEGTLYWTYKDADGEIQYTQGIPAQKEVYNAGMTVKSLLSATLLHHMEEIFK